jgi:hypothetical protein
MMKKIFLSLSLVAFTLATFAQPFTFGIKGGINSHTITTDSYKGITGYTWQDFKSDTKSGWNLGIFARIGDKVYLQPELVYTLLKSGSNVTLVTSTGNLTPGTYSQTFDVKEMEIPLLLGVKLIDLKAASIRAFTGPAMAVVLNNSTIGIRESGVASVPSTLYDPKAFKKALWNWQLGGGIDLGPLVFDVRYEWGLTNLTNGNVTGIGFVNKGNTLTFSLGIKFL